MEQDSWCRWILHQASREGQALGRWAAWPRETHNENAHAETLAVEPSDQNTLIGPGQQNTLTRLETFTA